MDNIEYWRDFQHGDDKAFSKLYDLLWKDLFCFAARMLQDKEVACDIVQEVFTKLWENRHNLQNVEKIKPYLYKWARNSVLNHFREQTIQEKHLEAFKIAFEKVTVENTLQEVIGKDMKNHIQRSMEQLPEKMREVFYLKIFEQLTVKEIAELLKISEQTVRNQISLATQKLKHIIVYLLLFLLK
jgi:RNA polymerase sigma-70 factor (ECF subfamily)